MNGAAEVTSILVLNVGRFRGSGPVLKEIVCVEDAIAKEVIGRSVKFVAAALGGDTDERAGAAAIFRRIGIGAHLKLLD